MSDLVRIQSYVEDRFVDGTDAGSTLLDPATEQPLATASTAGVDFGAALRHARAVGGGSLRALSFAARGAILKQLSGLIREHRDELYKLAMANGGATLGDARFDVDGASGTLAFYASLARGMGEHAVLADGDPLALGRNTPLAGQHLWTARRGAAVLVNAFNFPAWGFAEKLACALLAGMPVVVKPATTTALVAARIGELFVASGALPPGTWTFLAGSAGDLLDHLGPQDVLAFTGSATTGRFMRSHRQVLEQGVRVLVEADSLNSALLGPDVVPGSVTFELFVTQVAHEMTQKTGQKCTATRRIFVPAERLDVVQAALCERLAAVRVGNPFTEGVTMGPVVSAAQRDDVREGSCRLAKDGEVVFGVGGELRQDGGDPAVGFFVPPTLVRCERPYAAAEVHTREVFGPVATLMPYDGTARDAAALIARGDGSLVATVYADDAEFLEDAVHGIAPYHGRVVIGSAEVAPEALGPGLVLPGLVHGGPGRAGASEELGGLRGVQNYMQRTALQGPRALLDRLAGRGAELV